MAHGEAVTPVGRQPGERHCSAGWEVGEAEVVAERSLPAPELQPHGRASLGLHGRGTAAAVSAAAILPQRPWPWGLSPLRPLQSGGCPLGGPSSEITGDVPGPGEGQEQREARWQLSLSVSIVRRFPEPSCPQKQWRWTHVTSRVPLQNEAMEKQLIDPGLVPAPGHGLPLAGHPACLHASFHISLVVSMPRRQ